MKALSVRQPWADLICAGEKGVEFRSRPITHRGKLLVCSSKYDEGYSVEIGGISKPLPLGVMLAVVEVVDCRPVTKADSKEPGCPKKLDGYAWVLGDEFDILVPKPVKGMVGLFNVPDEEIESAPVGKFWYDCM